VAVGALLLTTNVGEIASWANLGTARWALYGLVPVLVAAAALRPRLSQQRDVKVQHESEATT
jgi:hypothetical protein